MRTPNTECFLCAKPLYRRPHEMAKARYAACLGCRSDAQKVAGVTERQHAGLVLGRLKGTNHRTGYRHREESKQKTAAANKRFWADHPERAAERGAKTRGEAHYKWSGGVSKLSLSIRQMTESLKWQRSVVGRDQKCVRCGNTTNLEAHHRTPLSVLMRELSIKSRDEARSHAAALWDISNGETLCAACHYTEHGRTVPPLPTRKPSFTECVRCGTSFAAKPSVVKSGYAKYCSRTCSAAWLCEHPRKGEQNPNWRGGRISVRCRRCENVILLKPSVAHKKPLGVYCSRECRYAPR